MVPVKFLAALALSLAFAACNSAPVPTLTDPKEIATRAAASVQSAQAIHARFSASGTVLTSGGRLSTGSGPTSIKLDGTTGQAWYDNKTQNARVIFDAPGFASSGGELIRVGGDVYMKLTGGASLLAGQNGGKYLKIPASAVPLPTPSGSLTDQVGSWLSQPGLVLLGVEKKNGRDSYHLRTTVPKDQVSEASKVGLDLGAVVVDVWVAVDNQQVTHVDVTSNGSTGSAEVGANLDYPGSVGIQAPPADQVVDFVPPA